MSSSNSICFSSGSETAAFRKGEWRLVRSAFTLIELLVVMGVVSILLMLTGVTIGNLGESRKLVNAGNMTVDLINQARQAAQTNNTKTMLAVVTDGSDSWRVLTMLSYSPDRTANGGWAQTDQWRTFPAGIRIDPPTADDFFQAPPAGVTLTRAGQTLDATKYASAIFLPNGRPSNTSSDPQIVQLQSANTPSPSNYYKIIVNQATGNPVIRRPGD